MCNVKAKNYISTLAIAFSLRSERRTDLSLIFYDLKKRSLLKKLSILERRRSRFREE